jgi:hypothetical protein
VTGGDLTDAAIRRPAVDYVESWLDGDADRMASCLHPDLVKRAVLDHDDAGSGLDEETFGSMTTAAVAEPKAAARTCEVTVIDVVGDLAAVDVVSEPFVDLLHVGRFEDRWLIVNALYQRRPAADASGDPAAALRVLDAYASSWFDRDVDRARSVYHPAFAERRIALSDGTALEEATIDDVVDEVADGPPEGSPRTWEARVLSVHGDVASGKVSVGPWDVLAHLARFGERWLIVNILYRSSRD